MSELLVVASKVKQYIREKSQLNTAASTLTALTDVIRSCCDQAISNAQAEGRKTVMDRDIKGSPSSCG